MPVGISLASLAAEGEFETCLQYASLVFGLIFHSLSDIHASLVDVQRTLVSLTNAVSSIAPQQSLGDNNAALRQQQSHRHKSPPASDPSDIPAAPIQVVRNMHYWITGQRPDGKSETTASGGPSAVSIEASSEGTYIRS